MEKRKPKVWEKTLQNNEPYKWYDWMKNKSKTDECRIYRDDWRDIMVDDIIYFKDLVSGEKIKTIVTRLVVAKTFGELYKKVGYSMVPISNITSAEVDVIYSKIFDKAKDKTDLEKLGAIAVGVCVIDE